MTSPSTSKRAWCSNTSSWYSRYYCCCHQTMMELSRFPLKQFSCPKFLLEDGFPTHWVNSFFIQCAEQIELSACKETPSSPDCNTNYISATHHPIPKSNNLILGGDPLMPYWFIWSLGWLLSEVISFLQWFLGPSSFCFCHASFSLFCVCDIVFIKKFTVSSAHVP